MDEKFTQGSYSVTNCYIAPKDPEGVITDGNLVLDGYAIIPREDWEKAEAVINVIRKEHPATSSWCAICNAIREYDKEKTDG